MVDSTDNKVWAPILRETASKFDELRRQWRDAVDAQDLPDVGEVIDRRFRVVRELGKGGFGCVFEVEHVFLHRQFALKLLVPDVAAQPGWATRFQEEARTTAQLGHPNIVFIADFGHCDDFGPYFVMEYLEGRSLRDILDERSLSTNEVVELTRHLASALDAAHARQVIHCDIKPQNVFRVDDGWKLLDFGTSSIVMSAWETQTLYGTPKYMSPEHAMGDAVDARADVFSLGVTVYEALTQQPPWDTKMWIHATPRWRRDHAPAPPSALDAAVPAQWDDAVMRAISIEPTERFPTAGEFAEQLASVMENRPATRPDLRALTPDTVIRPREKMSARRSVTPGEFFVMSRIGDGVALAELQRLCTGLPFDLQATVENMIERGYIEVAARRSHRDARQPIGAAREPSGPVGLLDITDTEVSEPLDLDALTERIEMLRQKGNFLGALETVRSAAQTWPDIAMLHFWYGTLLTELRREPEVAREAFRRAAALEPTNPLFTPPEILDV